MPKKTLKKEKMSRNEFMDLVKELCRLECEVYEFLAKLKRAGIVALMSKNNQRKYLNLHINLGLLFFSLETLYTSVVKGDDSTLDEKPPFYVEMNNIKKKSRCQT